MEQYILLENIIFESLSSSSSDSDDNNEELQNILFENRDNNNKGERKIVPKITHYSENVTRYTNIEFKSHFRMERNTFYFLLHLIGPKLENLPFIGREQINPTKQLLIAIYVLATPDSYRSICERFGVARSTAWFCVKRVV